MFLIVMAMPIYAINVISEKKNTADVQDMGCKKIESLRYIDVLDCPDIIAKINKLEIDIEVKAMDINANTQVNADPVNLAGNLGEGRTIVILDSGYNYDHVELSSSYLGGYDFVNKDYDPMDDNGHGTHVAGLITADGINATARGIAPETKIISGKVLNENATGTLSRTVEAIYWAVNGDDGVYGTADDPNADAISISIGTSPPYTYNTSCDIFTSAKTAIEYALSKNVVVVIAAGNYGAQGVSVPGCISSALTVGAVNSSNSVTSFSGKGNMVDVFAPGVSLFSTYKNQEYRKLSGTSMATPIVSGAVALVKAAHPEYSASQVIENIASSSEPKVLDVEDAVSRAIIITTYWTDWFDRDNPGGTGDWEHKQNFPDACETPLAVECKTLDGVDFLDAGQDVICNAQEGLVCYNNLNDNKCKDYKVRFLCTADTVLPKTPSEVPCLDDDGQDEKTRSTIQGLTTWGARYQSEILQDHCRLPKYVNEFFCNDQGYVDQKSIYCEFGCKNGACSTEVVVPVSEIDDTIDKTIKEKSREIVDEEPKAGKKSRSKSQVKEIKRIVLDKFEKVAEYVN